MQYLMMPAVCLPVGICQPLAAAAVLSLLKILKFSLVQSEIRFTFSPLLVVAAVVSKACWRNSRNERVRLRRNFNVGLCDART